jgi:hypothetical protein
MRRQSLYDAPVIDRTMGVIVMSSPISAEELQPAKQGPASTIKTVTWSPNRKLDHREWVTAGRRLGEITRCNQWWIGDWLCYGVARWGEKYVGASRITAYDVSSLRNMAWVAARFTPSRRRDNLSWSHHVAVAPLEPKAQDYWLDLCTSRRLSVADLRVELRTRRRCATEALRRKTTLSVCHQCGLTVVGQHPQPMAAP